MTRKHPRSYGFRRWRKGEPPTQLPPKPPAAKRPPDDGAAEPGTCGCCERPYPVGARIVAWGQTWAHRDCADYARNRARVLAGETYTGAGSSGYRIGKGPGSHRSRF